MYSDDLLQLSGSLRAIMIRSERVSMSDRPSLLLIREETLELQGKLYRIAEEALSTNLELMRSGNAPDRHLLLVISTSESLQLARTLTLSYLDTREKLFWVSALAAVKMSSNLQEAMK